MKPIILRAVLMLTAATLGFSLTSCSDDDKVPVTGLSLNQTSVTIEPGHTFQIVPTITPEDASNKGVTYETSDKYIATVDAEGLVRGVMDGTATITVRAKGNKSLSATLHVDVETKKDAFADEDVICDRKENAPVEASLTRRIGEELKLYIGNTKDGEAQSYTRLKWTSSNAFVASVEQQGNEATVKCIALGTVTITAADEVGGTRSFTLQVISENPLEENPAEPTMIRGLLQGEDGAYYLLSHIDSTPITYNGQWLSAYADLAWKAGGILEGENATCRYRLNASGLIAELSYKDNGTTGTNVTFTATYNDDATIKTLAENYTFTSEGLKVTRERTFTFTWKDGDLVSRAEKGKLTRQVAGENGKYDTTNSTTEQTLTYTYTEEENTGRPLFFAFVGTCLNNAEGEGVHAPLLDRFGLFGKGTVHRLAAAYDGETLLCTFGPFQYENGLLRWESFQQDGSSQSFERVYKKYVN
ncbi:MAG: Ig-like domain-containing protein [Alloprevotella sp.]|nr:Ig-like domain-containing protein [Alloprevotella sp.]